MPGSTVKTVNSVSSFKKTKKSLTETLTPPPVQSQSRVRGDLSGWRKRVVDAVAAAVAKAREEVAEQGLAFMGSEAVQKKSFLQRAQTYEAKWTINPVLAARDILVRKVFVQIEKAFQTAYRVALEAWRGGDAG